jgi:hypothetical protein
MSTTTPGERARLLELVVSAHRDRDPRGNVRSSPAFFDLDEAGRREAFDETMRSRAMEAALDAEGQSTTVKSVLRAVRGRAV